MDAPEAFMVVVSPRVVADKEGCRASPSYLKSGDWSVVHEVCCTVILVKDGLELPVLANEYST